MWIDSDEDGWDCWNIDRYKACDSSENIKMDVKAFMINLPHTCGGVYMLSSCHMKISFIPAVFCVSVLISSLLFSADFETSRNSHISHNHSNSKLNPEEFGWRIGCRVYRILLKCWSDLDLICYVIMWFTDARGLCDLRAGPPLVCVRFNPLIRETHSDGKRQECSSDWVWISKWDVIDEMDLFDGK